MLNNQEKIEFYEKLFWLAAREVVFFSTYDPKAEDYDEWFSPFLVCNDTFCYASADAEELCPEDADMAILLYKQYGWDGITALVSKLRKRKVLPQLQTQKYKEAMYYLGEDWEKYE